MLIAWLPHSMQRGPYRILSPFPGQSAFLMGAVGGPENSGIEQFTGDAIPDEACGILVAASSRR